MRYLLLISLSLLSICLLLLGPWPLLELTRSYLSLVVALQVAVAITFLKQSRGPKDRAVLRAILKLYIILTGLLVGSIIKTIFLPRGQVSSELLALMPSSKVIEYIHSGKQEELELIKSQILAVRQGSPGDKVMDLSLANFTSSVTIPQLNLQLFFKGTAQLIASQLETPVKGLDSQFVDVVKSLTHSKGGLVKFKTEGGEIKTQTNGDGGIQGYLAFMKLSDGETLQSLRESKASLRRLGALVRHLEGAVIILLDSRLSLFHKQIPYLEKVGRVKLVSRSGHDPYIFVPYRSLAVFTRELK